MENNVKKSDNITAIYLILVFFVFIILRNAWMSDDAYITFRTIENFIHKYGISYNVAERVQAYTHPLWMFILTFLYYGALRIFGDFSFGGLYYITMFTSIILSVSAVTILSLKIAKSTRSAILGLTILLLSKAFIDYSTSGLENPLSYLLLSLFLISYFKDYDNANKKLFHLTLIASFGSLNRLDSLVLFIPAIIWIYLKSSDKWKNARIIFLGFLPLLIWEIFSLSYYGYLFPNTAYAKLNTAIPQTLLYTQGLYYLINSISWDSITLLTIIFTSGMIFIQKDWKQLPLLFGIFIYLFYIIKIGGGFMSGRFLSMPLFLAVGLLTQFKFQDIENYLRILILFILVGISSPRSPIYSDETYGRDSYLSDKLDNRGISDERAFYYSTTGLFLSSRTYTFPASKWNWGFWVINDVDFNIVKLNAAGIPGYELGPNTHVIDDNALIDPLLARLPAKDNCKWRIGRIGHFKRAIPKGYLETLEQNSNQIVNPDLHLYYEKIRIITRGEIFTWDRFVEIWNFNTGKYNYLLEEFLTNPESVYSFYSPNCSSP